MRFQDLDYDLIGAVSVKLSLEDRSNLAIALGYYDLNITLAVISSWVFSRKSDTYDPDNTHIKRSNNYQGPPGSWVNHSVLSQDQFLKYHSKSNVDYFQAVVNANSSASLKLLFQTTKFYRLALTYLLPRIVTVVMRGDYQVYAPVLKYMFGPGKALDSTNPELLINFIVRFDDFEVETSNHPNPDFTDISKKYDSVLNVAVVDEKNPMSEVEPIRKLLNSSQVKILDYNVRSFEGFGKREQQLLNGLDASVPVKISSPVIEFTKPLGFGKSNLVLHTNSIQGSRYLTNMGLVEIIDSEITQIDLRVIDCKRLKLTHCLIYADASLFYGIMPHQDNHYHMGVDLGRLRVALDISHKDCSVVSFEKRVKSPRFEVKWFYQLDNPYFTTIEEQYQSDRDV